MLLVNSLIEGCKPYSAVAILKSRSEMSEPGDSSCLIQHFLIDLTGLTKFPESPRP